jgi:hypothetical protein
VSGGVWDGDRAEGIDHERDDREGEGGERSVEVYERGGEEEVGSR